jgi:MoxR-like ATPase
VNPPSSATADANPVPLEAARAAEIVRRIVANVKRVIHAPDELLRQCVMALVAEGHVILEDAPGVGKTMLAKALARSVDCHFSRIQFTPDLLPSDVTGVSVFNQKSNEFEFRPGPVFTNMLLVDEVNRASPKTQSALLECMQERQVTVDGVTRELDLPFMVIATQNPIEYEGTYPLPEAQLDRFMMLLHLGYPELADEARMLADQSRAEPLEALEPVATADDIRAAIAAAREMHVDDSLNRYAVALLRHTRADGRLVLGASPRAGIALMRVAKARALCAGRDYVIPDDLKEVARPVLSHRLIMAPEARSAGIEGVEIVGDAVTHTPVPL